MKQLSTTQRGSVATIVTIAVLAVGFVGAGAIAVWAMAGRADYKNNVDQKVASAVAENTKKVKDEDAKAYAIESQKPLKTYVGPEAYGSVNLSYPKNWSVYVAASASNLPVDLYANPDAVPGVTSETSSYALRMQIASQSYATAVKQYASSQQKGAVTIKPYVLPKNTSVTGVRIDGQLTDKKKGSLVLLPLRDKTLKIWVESSTYTSQFEEFILPNAHFTP